MTTVDRIPAVVNHSQVSVWTDGQNRPILFVSILIALMLLGSALRYLGRAVAPIGELVRLVLSALAVAVLLIGAMALLVAVLVVTAGSQ